MKTLPISAEKAPASTRQVLKGLQQNLDGQFNVDKLSAEKRIHVFRALHGWAEGLSNTQPKLTPIPTSNDIPVNIRPIMKTFHENLQAVYTPLAAAQRDEVATCITEWCEANQKVLTESETAGKGAGA